MKTFPDSMAVYVGVDDKSYLPWFYLSGVGLLGVFVVFGSTLWFSRKIARPLESLTTVARKISEGDLSARVYPQGSDEIDRFAASFDNMAEELAGVAERRRKFMSDISHEIRSPLTNIRSHIEAISDGMEKFSDKTLDSIPNIKIKDYFRGDNKKVLEEVFGKKLSLKEVQKKLIL